MLIMRDVTSHRSLEKVQNLNDMLNHLTATVTHEMMQPLACILGFANNLLETATSGQTIKQLNLIISSAKLLRCQLKDLLDRSLLDQGVLSPAVTSADVHELIKDVVDILSSQAEMRKIKIFQHTSTLKGKPLMIDPQRVQQILINLIQNATKFSNEGGRIRVSAF